MWLPHINEGGNWTLELNNIQGELKFFIIKGGGGQGEKEGEGEFLKFSLGGGIAGDKTSNRKQNLRMNLKMFS